MPESVITAIETGLTQVKTDGLAIMAIAVPIALALFGAKMAVIYGINFFKTVQRQ